MPEMRLVRPGTPEFYRVKAADLLKQAELATDEAARARFLDLADHWHRLALTTEKPNW